MDEIKIAASYVLNGVKDCFVGTLALRNFSTESPKQQSKQPKTPKSPSRVLAQCMQFGGLFLTGIVIFKYVIRNIFVEYLLSYLEPEERNSSFITGFLTFLECILGLFWTMPLFLLSKFLNFTWYQDIGKVAFVKTGNKQRNPAQISYELGDQIESTAVQMFFLLQAYLMFLLPLPSFIQDIFFILHIALLYSLYSFEYKWVLLGWGLQKRLNIINTKWPYFLGFGLPLAVISSLFGSFSINVCIFSTLFPLCVISSTATIEQKIQQFSFPIKFFGPTAWIVNLLFVTIFSKLQGRR